MRVKRRTDQGSIIESFPAGTRLVSVTKFSVILVPSGEEDFEHLGNMLEASGLSWSKPFYKPIEVDGQKAVEIGLEIRSNGPIIKPSGSEGENNV